ncbi:chromosome segregation protein SMC [Altericroceibacterium endophyticum]|uniref:Chromosome partition protein Smc n=1 Tax=Altericroceibacterium endophyticum TaxID=1808508 RepID=A0A6I4T9P1_9SPHN|nr:chromosome segregation protein SMC [Altericroceibacterium endophyticum]MXO66881.1 chromosome segregation protein SMC [Altericroceibacterium endophyticum]
MQFRKLKLSGFKSFVEPAELHIEPGLTGVVGPNGCGKSNLLEAIRWVMGENSPKSLRSGGMDDVIFAGTQQRPPRDFAEVVLDASDANNQELQVTRRIERGAGSAYRVNGRDVRAKDVALTFADAATGAHSPALVSQGRIAAVIAAKPAERRQMLEEAAGIAGLHVRRRDAESKLRQTESNLARLEDLMAGLDSQIASLRRQARQAERYRELSEKISAAEARVLFARWRDAAASAQAAQSEAQAAEKRVDETQSALTAAQKTQRRLAEKLAAARDVLADRRDDANAHGHRLASLNTQLEAAEQRLADLDRQKKRLEDDRVEADRITTDAAKELQRLEKELTGSEQALQNDEAKRPELARAAEKAENASRMAELALAKATADHAGVEADWRVAESEQQQAANRLERLRADLRRQQNEREELLAGSDPEQELIHAQNAYAQAQQTREDRHNALVNLQSEKDALGPLRDEAAAALSAARAELTGTQREYQALQRDRQARAKQASNKFGLPAALDTVRAEPGYERAVAAVLGRDAKAPLGTPPADSEGRFWTGGRTAPQRVADSLLDHVSQCPDALQARLALVHVADQDDGRDLAPGQWLVTRGGFLRRWDGFVARGEGAAEAARLEADNRHAQLERMLPALQETADQAEQAEQSAREKLAAIQQRLVAAQREEAQAQEQERQALRRVDQAEAARERLTARLEEFARSLSETETRMAEAQDEAETSAAKLAALPPPETGRANLDAARTRNESARGDMQSAAAALAAHDQALAVARERSSAQRADIKGWEARAGDAARRLAETSRRFEEIAEERAIIAAKPESLLREIEQGEAIKQRLTGELTAAEEAVSQIGEDARASDAALTAAGEALSQARENRAALSAKAENEESRRAELARSSGERFHCPPPLLSTRFSFDPAEVKDAEKEGADLEQLVTSRERIGPVNLVAAQELQDIEARHGASAEEQAELAEAVNRLRGSIGNLNREGRERLRAAFEAVNEHFKVLFTKLFEGGQAHLALVDSDDPLEAGLEIFAQPPGKRLQSLTLLSGGEQALTAVALIFGLFLTNPAPICVLDEVDAPLDDANIDRFCDLLDHMVEQTKTRYLIVTHNAVTMSRMHRLFGVTMVEHGVSRLVSVDLGGAEELLAAE